MSDKIPLEQIELLAREALQRFDEIATVASNELGSSAPHGSDVLAYPNAAGEADVRRRRDEVRKGLRELQKEPAIARVVVIDDNGQKSIWYFCRATALTGFEKLAGYRSRTGRMASLPAGSDFEFPNGNRVRILEQTTFRPSKRSGAWDSTRTVISVEQVGTATVRSLRRFADEHPTENILDQMLADDNTQAGIVKGIRRDVIEKMALRDQPVLDHYQDTIFRLPLDSRLMVVGPPGTGKTTTLIRRLGQKLDAQESILTEQERQLIDEAGRDSDALAHSTSWMMFTPTQLLKGYLKEAFAHEGIPSSDRNITTWEYHRKHLAKDEFNILRKSDGSGGGFIFKDDDDVRTLLPHAIENSRLWFTDFYEWQQNDFLASLGDAAQSLATSKIGSFGRLGRGLDKILERTADGPLSSILEALAIEAPKIQNLVSKMKKESNQKIDAALNRHLNSDRDFLQNLANYLKPLKRVDTQEEDDEVGAEEDDDDAVSTGEGTPLIAARDTYRRAVSAQARAAASGRPVGGKSRKGRVTEWIGERTLPEEERVRVGQSLLAQTAARRFSNPVKHYLDRMATRYRAFRQLRQLDGKWYLRHGYEPRYINALELDVVLLAVLRTVGDLLGGTGKSALTHLESVRRIYRNQIVVDEATDFSPIQLACMEALAHRGIRSFFACGDFNQRLTTWGTRSVDDLKWACLGLDIEEITVSYRQTKQLVALTRAMMQSAGEPPPAINLPKDVQSDGFAPVLLVGASLDATVDWLVERIREIDSFVDRMPSTAILVSSEADVEPVANALHTALTEHNIHVKACLGGQAVGDDSDVRVFNVEHIKGLEFEAVFFIEIDCLATREPTLFARYLYVGATRAATYLGLTCKSALPERLAPLRHHFKADWSQRGA